MADVDDDPIDGRLTPRQAHVIRLLYETALRHGYQPSYREIAAELGMKTARGAQTHLLALQRKGWVEITGRMRAVRLLRRPDGREFTGFAERPPAILGATSGRP